MYEIIKSPKEAVKRSVETTAGGTKTKGQAVELRPLRADKMAEGVTG